MGYLYIILFAYLCGTPNPSLLFAKLKGVDLERSGTGNPGASNAALLMGVPLGIAVAAFDIGKAVFAVRVCRRLFPALTYAGVVSGASCVLGHMYPFYRRFRGGKGFASYVGMILALDWRFIVYFLLPVVLMMLVTDDLVFGNLSTMVLFPIYCAVRFGLFTALLLCMLSGVMLLRHRENLAGICRGTEKHIRHREQDVFRLEK